MTERQPTASFPPNRAPDSVHAESTPHSVGSAPTGVLPGTAEAEVLPRAFGRYELRRLLGRGGMGRVYLAHDPQLDRLVALKVPNPVAVAGWRERFVAEARAAATLTHPNVCPVYEVGDEGGQPYLTMGYIEGETLADRLDRDGPMDPGAAVELVITVARAMQEAHRRGIVHRDLKPANLMIDRAGRPVIMDFGLAIRSTSADDLRLTLTGVALGTPAYMPPEQAGGDTDAIGPPSDVYALGVILYELLTGRVPFKAKSFGKLLAKIERDAPPPPSSINAKVDPALEAVTLTCLAKVPGERFDTAGDLADALNRYLEGDRHGLISLYSRPFVIPEDRAGERTPPPASTMEYRRPPRRRWALAGAAALLLLLTAAAGVIYVQTDYGDLEVRLNDPTAKVKVRVEGKEVKLESDGRTYRVRAGRGQKLEIVSDDFETVAETFDLKRGGETIVQVALVPKNRPGPIVPPKKEPDPIPGGPGASPAPLGEAAAVAGAGSPDLRVVEVKPPPVPFPDKATLVEADGWQLLTDASKDDMQKWLAARKKDKHSVLWLDAVEVSGKPLFSAVAALDDRRPDWVAHLDLPGAEANDTQLLIKRFAAAGLDMQKYVLLSMSGYGDGAGFRAAALFDVGTSLGQTMGALPLEVLDEVLRRPRKPAILLMRPFPASGQTLYALLGATRFGKPTPHAYDLTAAATEEFVAQARKDGNRVNEMTVYWVGNELRFAVVCIPNPDKLEWETDTNLTAAEFKAKAADQAQKRLRPACVTACPFDKAVRYCVVWVKEPLKSTPYPKGPVIVKRDGWESILDASKEDMQKWLDARKKDKHSVLWLDAALVDGKPLYSAVAALDDRQPEWVTMLDVASEDLMKRDAILKLIEYTNYRVTALSSFAPDGNSRSAVLWHPGKKVWGLAPANTADHIEKAIANYGTRGVYTTFLRPFRIGAEGTGYALYGEFSTTKRKHALDKSEDEVLALLADARKAGEIPLSVAAVILDERPAFSVVTAPGPKGVEWEVDTKLTVARYQTKAADRAKDGFRPANVTAYGYDGAVRYCVIWVKEPPRPVEFPKEKTLIPAPGWEVLVDATKEDMQKWLDARKKDKHSVLWLDVVEVSGKPLFSAVAALDDRRPDWVAILDLTEREMNDVKLMEKRIVVSEYFIVATSGYSLDGTLRSVALFQRGPGIQGLVGVTSIPNALRNLTALTKDGYAARVLRPFPVGRGQIQCGVYLTIQLGASQPQGLGLTEAELNEKLEATRKAGARAGSLVAYLDGEEMRYALTTRENPSKALWQADRGLTATDLQAKAAEQLKNGFAPACVTAYAHNGAVRYCVVWVKEPPKKP